MSKTKNLTHASLDQNVLYTLFFIVCFTSYLEKSTKNKSENISYQFTIVKIFELCHVSYIIEWGKIRHFRNVLFVLLPYLDPEISPFF